MLSVASKLFAKHGYVGTSMEDIAAAADVSIGTLYNYFRSKAELVESITKAERELSADRAARLLANPPDDPVDAVVALMEVDNESEPEYLDRAVWPELFAAAFQAAPEVTKAYVHLQLHQNAEKFRRLLKLLQKSGRLRPSADIVTLAEVLSALSYSYFTDTIVNIRTHPKDRRIRLLTAERRRDVRRHVRQVLMGSLV